MQSKSTLTSLLWCSGILAVALAPGLNGTIRRVPIDAHHPTGWIYATTMFTHAIDLPFDPAAAMPAAEQLVGKKAVFTGTLQGETRTGLLLVADSLEPQ